MGVLRRGVRSIDAGAARPVNRHAIDKAILTLSAGGLCALMALPLLWALVSSLQPLDLVYAFPPTWSVNDPRWSNYGEALTRLPVPRFLLNSLIISGASVVGAVLTASMAGFALARIPFHGRRACVALVLLSLMIPAQLLLIPRFLLYDALGWVGTYKPLIVPAWLGGGAFNILLFRQFFRTIPTSFDDAARMDGATPWQTYWRILLPMARPASVTAAIMSFVFHWQEFLDPLIYLSDFMSFPIALGIRMLQSTAGTWANLLMAASLIALLPIAAVVLCAQRYSILETNDAGR